MNRFISYFFPSLNSSSWAHAQKSAKHYTLLDVCKAQKFLVEKVPPELAAIILDYAEFWIGQISRRSDEYAVYANGRNESDASMYYLITDPIPSIRLGGESCFTKVRRIRFTLLSHDQGWGGQYDCQGTYKASWSWFEAGIIKSTSLEDIPTDVRSTSKFDASAFHTDGYEVENPQWESNRWFLQNNIHVSKEKKKHVIEWTYDDDDFPDGQRSFLGRGHGEGFLAVLQEGYRICVVVRAQYPGWANHIYDLKVETFTTF